MPLPVRGLSRVNGGLPALPQVHQANTGSPEFITQAQLLGLRQSGSDDHLVHAGRIVQFHPRAERGAEPDLIARGLSAKSKPGAFAFMLKMLLTRVPDLDKWKRDRGHPLLANPVLAQDSAEWCADAEQQTLNLLPISNKYDDQG